MQGFEKRILIADDHDIIRRGLRSLLELRPNMQVVAEAATGLMALKAARETQPDIAIVDYALPGMNGRDLTMELLREQPRMEVLIYTLHDREDVTLEVLKAGARGFVFKSDTETHLIAALDALSVHRPYFSGAISETLLNQYLRAHPGSVSGALTLREREVVQLIAEGLLNKQIAEALNISIKTVQAHRATAMHKLKLKTAAELVCYAIRNNIATA